MSLVISGQFRPGDAARLASLDAGARTRRVKELTTKKEGGREIDVWSTASCAEEAADVREHIRDILDRFHERRGLLSELASRYESYFSCAIFVDGAQGPECYLEADLLRKISAVGAGVDFDIYCTGVEGDEQGT